MGFRILRERVRIVSIMMALSGIPDRSSPPAMSVAIASKSWR